MFGAQAEPAWSAGCQEQGGQGRQAGRGGLGRGVAESQARLREMDRPETSGGSYPRVARWREGSSKVLISAGAPFTPLRARHWTC